MDTKLVARLTGNSQTATGWAQQLNPGTQARFNNQPVTFQRGRTKTPAKAIHAQGKGSTTEQTTHTKHQESQHITISRKRKRQREGKRQRKPGMKGPWCKSAHYCTRAHT